MKTSTFISLMMGLIALIILGATACLITLVVIQPAFADKLSGEILCAGILGCVFIGGMILCALSLFTRGLH